LEGKTISVYTGKEINGNLEEIPFGDFIIDKSDDEDAKNKTTFNGYDYMINFNKTYIDNNTYPIKLNELFQNLCVQVGLEAGNINFPNKDYIIKGNPFTNNETCKKVLSSIAQLAGGFAEIGRDNKVYIKNLSLGESVETVDGNIYYDDFKKNDLFGTINTVVVGLKDVEGENVTKDNTEMMKLAGGKQLYNVNEAINTSGIEVLPDNENFITLSCDNTKGSSIEFRNYFNKLSKNLKSNTKYYLVSEIKEVIGNGNMYFLSTYPKNSSQFLGDVRYPFNQLQDNKIYIDEITTLPDLSLATSSMLRTYCDFPKGTQGSITFRLSILEKKPNLDNFIYEPYIKQGVKELSIKEEYFMITDEERRKVIDELYDNLIGLKYLPFETNYYGLPYLDRGDKIEVLDNDDFTYPTYVFNHNFKYNGAYSGNIKTPKISTIEEKAKNNTDLKTKFKNVELSVNKIDGKITSVIEQVDEYNSKISSIEETIDSINLKVENIADLTREVLGITKIQLDNCMAGELIELHIYGNNTVFDSQYLSDDLYLNDDVELFGDSFIKITRQVKDGETVKEEYEIIDLGIDMVLRQYEGVFDEYVIKDNKAKIIRRIGIDDEGDKYILENEMIEDLGELILLLGEGTNYIEILNYFANIKAKYVVLNDFTSKFATTTEVRAMIQILTREILLEVSQKVNEDEIIASLNLAIENDKGIVKLIGNSVIINSDYFTLDENGKIKISSNLNKKYVYTDLDIYLALSHIKGLVILPEELLKIYRCVSSGTNFTVTDVVAMQNIKNGTKEPVVNINSVLSIDNENLEKTINIKINDNLQTLIGLFQIYTYMMKTNYLFIGEGYSTELNTVKYGIQLDGRRKKIRIIDDNAQVGTEIDANAVDSGIGYFSDGQRKGRVMHSPDVDIDGPDHTYWCHYTGNAIAFHVDANKNTNFSVSSFWINSGSSDERLKDSIERIDENLLKV